MKVLKLTKSKPRASTTTKRIRRKSDHKQQTILFECNAKYVACNQSKIWHALNTECRLTCKLNFGKMEWIQIDSLGPTSHMDRKTKTNHTTFSRVIDENFNVCEIFVRIPQWIQHRWFTLQRKPHDWKLSEIWFPRYVWLFWMCQGTKCRRVVRLMAPRIQFSKFFVYIEHKKYCRYSCAVCSNWNAGVTG